MASTITSKEYTGNGSLKTFTYTFQSYQKEDVKVKVNETDVTNFTIPNYAATGGTVTFNNTGVNGSVCESDGSPKNGLIVRVYRDTDITAGSVGEYEPKATYQAGSSIKAADLNNNAKQALYAAFEAKDQEIQSVGIADDAITGAKIADDSIDSEHYVDGSIDTAHIANDAVTTDKIADGTIQAGNIGANAITNGKMADGSVGANEIVSGSVDSQHYADGSIDRVHLEADIIDGTKLADNAVDSEHITDGSIDTAHLSGGLIQTDKILNGAVTGAKIANNTITATQIANDTITSTKIADDAVTNDHLAIDSVASPQIRDNNVTTAKILDGNVTRAKLQDDCINATKIEDNAIDSEHYTDGSIDRVHLEADIKDSTKLADNAVGTEHIADAELTTLAGMESGTASILAGSGVSAGTALTANIDELNLLDGKSIVTSISSPTDVQIPTAQAVEERIVDLVTDVGGFRPIANETSFPTTNPDPEDNAGTIVSVKALASNLTSNGSGVATIANGAGSGNTVTINGMANSDTIEAGKGILVETTSTLHTYTFHRETLAPADITAAQSAVTDFNQRYQVAGSTPTQQPDGTALAEGDLFFDTAANKMKVYDGSNYGEVTSTGDFKYLFLCPANGSGTPDLSNTTFDLREGSNSGSAASVTNAAQLIVSVNGVIQKANTGTSAPAEGFAMVDANTIIFGAAPGTGASVFIHQAGSAVSIPTPGDNTVSTAKYQNNSLTEEKLAISNAGTNNQFLQKQSGNTGGLTWADVPAGVGGANTVNFNDNVAATWGTNTDELKILYDTTTGVIQGKGASGGVEIRNSADDGSVVETAAKFLPDGAVELYHNNLKKLETTATGATVTGTLAATALTGDGSALTGIAIPKLDAPAITGGTEIAPSGI